VVDDVFILEGSIIHSHTHTSTTPTQHTHLVTWSGFIHSIMST